MTRIVLAALAAFSLGAGATRRARLSTRCGYRVRMPAAGSFRARFAGNTVLRPARAG